MRTLLLCVWLLGGLLAQIAASPQALVVIVLPGTSLADWQNADAPHLHRLMQTGAVAVMNTRTAHRAGAQEQDAGQSALLTLGAGSRAAEAVGAAGGFLPPSAEVPGIAVQAGRLYTRRTGLVPRPGQWVCASWPAVLSANADPGYDLHIGSLGEALTAHGVQLEAGGGADADWIAASHDGTVAHLSKLTAAPGVCLIWDAGPDVAAADAAIGRAAAQIAALQGRLIVLSPYASPAAYARNERLTPVLVWGKDIPAGLLLSSSTRRPGLVTNTDFAPAVAGWFGILRTSFSPLPFGYPWSEAVSANAAETTLHLSRDAVRQSHGMALLPYLALGLGLWISAVTAFASRWPVPDILALAPLCAAAAMLFSVSAAWFWALLPSLLTLAVLLAHFAGKHFALTCLTASLTLALMVDMVTGNTLMRHGLLGYSAIEGARYYGIGNEAMGLLLSAALVTVVKLWSGSRTRQAVLAVIMGVIVLLLGSAGAKAGGVLVSLLLFGTFLYAVSGRRWTWRAAAYLAGIVAAGMALAAFGNAFVSPAGHSHIGEAVSRIASGGADEAWDIIRRKLATESRLAYHSAWAALLWPAALCLAFLRKRMTPIGRMLPPSQADAALWPAGAVNLLACLLLNDAGVVAAALSAVVLWSEVITQKSLPALKGSRAGRP